MPRWPVLRIGGGGHAETPRYPVLRMLLPRPALFASLINRLLCRASPYIPIFECKSCLYLAMIKSQVARRTSPARLVGGPYL